MAAAEAVGRIEKQIEELEQQLERARQHLQQARQDRAESFAREIATFGLVDRTDEELFGALKFLQNASPNQWKEWQTEGQRFLKIRKKTGRRPENRNLRSRTLPTAGERAAAPAAAGETPANLDPHPRPAE